MRKVELVPGIFSSVLGFGCAPILGAVDSNKASTALDVALEVGITHLDIAPSYGYGEAETWLGKALRGRRDKVVLATKFGIQASSAACFLRPLKPIVRWMRRHRLSSRPTVVPLEPSPPRHDRFHINVPMEPLGLRHSVEQSLLRLRTDRLDFLLLHEPRGPLVHIDVLAETATQLKQEGKIVGWGLAYNITLADIHADNLSRFDVLQFNVNISDIGYESLRLMRKDAANIFFSPFRTAPTAMSRAEVLSRLMLDFPRSVVLCSMFNPEHIRANAAAVA